MVVLKELQEQPDTAMYGQQLVKLRPDELTESAIYTILARMIARGYLEARIEGNNERKMRGGRGPARRLYEMTPFGQQAYQSRLKAEQAINRVEANLGAAKPKGAL
ncbi:MAG: PadR family transcriptional regulator [Alphaproteobacteria bacterium]|nr:PadR family transcriptional regulator [Alphaproteobacteria bacterium]